MQVQNEKPIRCPRRLDVSVGQKEVVGDAFCGTTGTSQLTMTAPIGAAKGWSEASLNESARDFVLSRTGPEAEFGELNGGNCGLTAYVPSNEKAQILAQVARELCPGSEEFQKLQFDPDRQRLLGVLVSDPEPRLFLNLQDRTNGECKVVGEFSFVGGGCSSNLSEATQEALIPKATGIDRDDDWNFQNAALLGSSSLPLGETAGHPFWWLP